MHPHCHSVWELLERAQFKAGGHLAVADETDTAWSYASIHILASRLAESLLISHGAHHGDRIGVLFYNSVEFVVSQFAIAKFGAIAVNLNAHFTAAEHVALLQDCDATFIITSAELEDTATNICSIMTKNLAKSSTQSKKKHGSYKIQLVTLSLLKSMQIHVREVLQATTTIESRTHPCDTRSINRVNSHIGNKLTISKSSQANTSGIEGRSYNPFQMIYTSGTTGKPKGVVHSQSVVTAHAYWMAAHAYTLSHLDVWLHMAPMFHAMDLCAVFGVVASGGSQVKICTPRTSFILRIHKMYLMLSQNHSCACTCT